MANFSIIQPLAETVDRTGQSFETGRAGANTSPLGSAIEGYTRTRGNLAKIDALEKQTAATYNPDKLAADKVRRDLHNDVLEQALEKSRLDNIILEETGLDRAEETINESRTRQAHQKSAAARNAEIVRISKGSGMQTALSKAAETRANATNLLSTAHARDVDTILNAKYGGRKREADIVDTFGRGVASIAKASGAGSAGGRTASLDPFSDIPTLNNSDSKPQSALDKTIASFLNASESKDNLEKQGKLELETSKQILANNTKRTENAVTRKSADYLLEAHNAAEDRSVGNGNASAGLDPLTKLSALLDTTTDDSQKAYLGKVLESAMKSYGGPDEYLEQLESEITDPKALKAAKASVYEALARTGNREMLPTEQKDIYDSFVPALGPKTAAKFVADPEGVYGSLEKLISGNSNKIQDSDFKRSLRTNEYVVAASEASRNGTQSYKIIPGRVESGGAGSDIAGQDTSSQMVIKFIGADGTTGVAPVPGNNPEDEPVLNMLDEVSKRSEVKGQAQQQAQQGNQQVQERNASTAAPGRAPTVIDDVTPQENSATVQGADVATPANVSEADVVGAPSSSEKRDPNDVPNAEIRANTILTDPSAQADRLQEASTGLDRKDALASADRDITRFNSYAKDVRKRIQDTASNVDTIGKRARIFTRVVELVEKNPELKSFLGAGGRFKRGLAEVLSKVPGGLNDDETNELLELGEQAQGSSVLELVSRGLAAKIMDTEAEKKALTSFMGSLDRGIIGMRELSKFTSSTHGAVRSINKLEGDLVALGVRPGAATRIVEDYRQKHSQKQVLTDDGKMVENKNYLSLEDFKKRHNLLRTLSNRGAGRSSSAFDLSPVDSGGEGASPLTKPASVGGEEDPDDTAALVPISDDGSQDTDPLEPEAATPDNTEEAKRIVQTSEAGESPEVEKEIAADLDAFDTAGLESPELNKSVIQFGKDLLSKVGAFAVRAGKGGAGSVTRQLGEDAATSMIENVQQGRLDRESKVFKERASQDPEFRKALDQAKKNLSSKEYNSTIGRVVAATSYNDVTLKDMLLMADATTNSALGGLIGDAQDFASDMVAKVTGDSPEFDKALRKELREDFQLQNPGMSLMADVIAFGFVSSKLKAGAAALKGAATKAQPITKAGLDILDGTKKASTLAGRTAAKTAQIGGQAAVDAAATVVASDEGTVRERAAVGAIGSVVGQGLGKAVSAIYRGGKGGLKNLAGTPDEIKGMAELLAGSGSTGDNILAKVHQAESMSTGKFGANLIALLDANERQVVETVLESAAGNTARQSVATQAAKSVAANKKEAARLAGVTKAGTTGDIAEEFATQVGTRVDEVIAQNVDTAATVTKKELTALLSATEKGIQKDAQLQLNRINGLVGRKAPSVAGSAAKTNVSASTQEALTTRMSNLEATKQLLSKSLRGEKGEGSVFKAAEAQYKDGFGSEAIPKMIKRLQGVKGVGEKKFQKIIQFVNESTQGAENAARAEILPAGANNVVQLGNSFKHLAELHQVIRKAQYGDARIAAGQASAMLKVVDSTIESALKDKGADPRMFKKLLRTYGETAEIEKRVIGQQKFFETLQNDLWKTELTPLHDKAFNTPALRSKLQYNFGDKGVDVIEKGLQSYDRVVTKLNKLTNSDRITRVAAADLSPHLEKALKLTGPNASIGKALIEGSKNTNFISDVTHGLGAGGKDLVRRSIMSDVAVRAREFAATKAGVVLDSKAFKPKEILGLNSAQWDAVKGSLLPKQTALLETYFDRVTATNSVEALQNLGVKAPASGFSAFLNTVLRRSKETHGLSLVDLATGRAFAKMESSKQQAIVKHLVAPDPKKVNEFFKQVAGLLETETTLAGQKVVIKQTKDQIKGRVRALLVGAWTSKIDNAQQRSSIRRNRVEALKELQKLK